MSKFKVGDRVRHKVRASYGDSYGDGTIDWKDKITGSFRVQFDCGILWWCHAAELTPLRKVSPRKNETKTTFDGASSVGTVNKLMYVKNGKKVVWVNPEKKKRPAYWIEVENRRGVIILYLRGRNNFKLVQFYKKYNVAVQQAKRLAKQLGLEVRK